MPGRNGWKQGAGDFPGAFLLPSSLLLLLVSASAGAQDRTLRVDIGPSRMTFADSIAASAFNVSPALSITRPRGSVSAFGTFSRLAQSWSNSGTVSASLNTARPGMVAGEVEGIAGGSMHSDATRTGQMIGNARLYLSGTASGAWVGAGLGRTWDGAWRSVVQGEAGIWASSGDNSFSASFTPTRVDDTVRYADALLSAQHTTERWEAGASAGVRTGDPVPTLPANNSVWGSASAVYWATPTLGIVVSAGTYPVDLTQGYPGGNYASLSLRLRARNTVPSPRRVSEGSGTEAGTLRVSTVSGDSRRVRVYAPGARTVELLGDFTLWEAVPLLPDGRGWWAGTVGISSGAHEVNVRVDGATWLVPPGLTMVKDEFGGSAGLLIIPE